MENSNTRFYIIIAGILLAGAFVFGISYFKNLKEPVLKTDSPFVQEESIIRNACGDGISIEDCNMDKDK